jgi:septum formation protein
VKNLVLASGSPRRRDLLQWCGYHPTVQPQQIDESPKHGELPVPYALRLAQEKAEASPESAIPVVAADTIVHMNETIFGKPKDREHGRNILRTLSGCWHTVTTAVCVRQGTHVNTFAIHTRVRMRELSAAELESYLDSGEGDDKAGAYGIQGRAGTFVAEVQGSWTNVMGLPVEEVLHALSQLER